jgi:hypothetical protein
MAMVLCAGVGQACMSYRCMGMQPPHRVVHWTLFGLPVSQQVFLAHLGMSGSGCSPVFIVADRWSVALDLSTDFVGDVQTEGTERPHQATSSQQPQACPRPPCVMLCFYGRGHPRPRATCCRHGTHPGASCVLDDLVDGLANVRVVRAHNELHGHAPRGIDSEGQPHKCLQRGLHVSSRPESSLFSIHATGWSDKVQRVHHIQGKHSMACRVAGAHVIPQRGLEGTGAAHPSKSRTRWPLARRLSPQGPRGPRRACASPMSVPASRTVCERALGGTASVPSHGAMPRMPTTASTASCATNPPHIVVHCGYSSTSRHTATRCPCAAPPNSVHVCNSAEQKGCAGRRLLKQRTARRCRLCLPAGRTLAGSRARPGHTRRQLMVPAEAHMIAPGRSAQRSRAAPAGSRARRGRSRRPARRPRPWPPRRRGSWARARRGCSRRTPRPGPPACTRPRSRPPPSRLRAPARSAAPRRTRRHVCADVALVDTALTMPSGLQSASTSAGMEPARHGAGAMRCRSWVPACVCCQPSATLHTQDMSK